MAASNRDPSCLLLSPGENKTHHWDSALEPSAAGFIAHLLRDLGQAPFSLWALIFPLKCKEAGPHRHRGTWSQCCVTQGGPGLAHWVGREGGRLPAPSTWSIWGLSRLVACHRARLHLWLRRRVCRPGWLGTDIGEGSRTMT